MTSDPDEPDTINASLIIRRGIITTLLVSPDLNLNDVPDTLYPDTL